jgi:hypothetical protein
MKVLVATLALLLSSPAAAQECKSCSEASFTHQTVALDVVRRPKATPIHELER